jgi:hypothetical protein
MLGTAVGFTLLELLVRLLLVLMIPVLLAWAVHSLGRRVRMIARIIYTVPIALYIPVAIAIVWPMLLSPAVGLTNQPFLAGAATARLTVLVVDGIYTLGLMCGLGLIFFLPALQQPDDQGNRKWIKPVLAIWGTGLLVTAALSIQSFTINEVMTNGGPANSTLNLMLYSFKAGFVTTQLGYASAIGVAVMLMLGLLGIAATAILVFTNLRFSLLDRKANPVTQRPAGSIVLVILALILVLAVSLPAILAAGGAFIMAFARGPKTSGAGSQLGGSIQWAQVFVNTVLPALVSSFFIQLPIAYLGALGIGGLRPLGRRSEWLLLLFSPWLFVGVGAIATNLYPRLAQLKLINTIPGLISPFFLNVIMLVILTLFFKGQEPRWREATVRGKSSLAAFFKELVLPSLPLALLLGLADMFIQMRDLFLPLIVAFKPSSFTFSVLVRILRGQSGPNAWPLISHAFLLFEVPAFIVLTLALWAFQLFYLDRLTLSAEKEK